VTWAVEGRAGLREAGRAILKWRVGASWYVVALLLPIVAALSSYGLYLMLGGRTPQEWAAPSWLSYVPLFLFVLFLGGGNEEPGWRGFALPRLQDRYGALVASVVLGLFWAFWHLPLFFSPASTQHQLGIPFLWYVVYHVALTIRFTWLFNNAGRSVFLAMLMHAQNNVIGNWFPLQSQEGAISPFMSMVIVEWVIAIILVVAYGPSRLSRRLQH
jgi:membrane protease YdiL (CAAX protease family)